MRFSLHTNDYRLRNVWSGLLPYFSSSVMYFFAAIFASIFPYSHMLVATSLFMLDYSVNCHHNSLLKIVLSDGSHYWYNLSAYQLTYLSSTGQPNDYWVIYLQ
ncbi:hypothetical protein VPH35_073763 [Triticum aestivum]